MLSGGYAASLSHKWRLSSELWPSPQLLFLYTHSHGLTYTYFQVQFLLELQPPKELIISKITKMTSGILELNVLHFISMCSSFLVPWIMNGLVIYCTNQNSTNHFVLLTASTIRSDNSLIILFQILQFRPVPSWNWTTSSFLWNGFPTYPPQPYKSPLF